MARIGKISPIKRKYNTYGGTVRGLGSALADQGMTMLPGTFNTIVPYMESNGEYRTGLNPDALYIRFMSPEEQEQEKKKVAALRDELEKLTNLDLSPRSKFYTDMWSSDPDASHAEAVKLFDGSNTYNLDEPKSAITFAWLRVHPEIAPSFTAWETGKSTPKGGRCSNIADCKFFVDDEEHEASVAYNKKTLVNKAVNLLESMSHVRRLKVAKLLGLPVAYNANEDVVYNELDTYIKASEIDGKKTENLRNFNSIAKMEDDNIEVRYRVKEALDFNVYRKAKLGKIQEGETPIAESEEELVDFLSNVKNQDSYRALIKKIDNAKSVAI
jgi:hypothetical protein